MEENKKHDCQLTQGFSGHYSGITLFSGVTNLGMQQL